MINASDLAVDKQDRLAKARITSIYSVIAVLVSPVAFRNPGLCSILDDLPCVYELQPTTSSVEHPGL